MRTDCYPRDCPTLTQVELVPILYIQEIITACNLRFQAPEFSDVTYFKSINMNDIRDLFGV